MVLKNLVYLLSQKLGGNGLKQAFSDFLKINKPEANFGVNLNYEWNSQTELVLHDSFPGMFLF